VPFVLKLDDVMVTSPSWLPNQFPRQSSGNKQYPSTKTATKQCEKLNVNKEMRRTKHSEKRIRKKSDKHKESAAVHQRISVTAQQSWLSAGELTKS